MSPEVKLFGDCLAVVGSIVYAIKTEKPLLTWSLVLAGAINLDGIVTQAIIIAAK